MVDLIAAWLGEWPDLDAPSENTVNCERNPDVPNIDLWAMLTEGTRMWDEESGGIYKRLLEMPTEQLNRFYDKVWRLACLHHYDKCPDDLLQYLVAMVGFGQQQGKASDLAALLDFKQTRLLIKIAVTLWMRRGRLDLVADAIRLFASRVRPRIITWFWRQSRIGSIHVGAEGRPRTDIRLLTTPLLNPLAAETDAFRTLIRVSDYGALNRSIVEALAELNRPSHEYFEIGYVDFIDTFNDGRLGHWEAVDGAPGTVVQGDGTTTPETLPALQLPPGARERVITPTCFTWVNYIAKFYVEMADGGDYRAEFRFYVQEAVADEDCYAIEIFEVGGTQGVGLSKLVSGVLSSLHLVDPRDYGLPLDRMPHGLRIDLENFEDGGGAVVAVRVYLDETHLFTHEIVSPADFTGGTIELYNNPGSDVDMSVSYPEVFQKPLDITILQPEAT